MSITLSALQKQRRDSAANWTAENPTLLAGEIGIESDTDKIKIGNGSTAWTSLGYQGIIPSSGAYPLSQLLMPSGTVSAPSLSFDGDTNLGIYRSGTDQLSFTTAGTERLRIDATGQIEAVSLGTAAAPTFSFTGDPNTGIYSPGADQVAISTGGSGRLFVDASGRVLIGASSTSSTSSLLIQGSTDQAVVRLATGKSALTGSDILGQVVFTDSGHSTAAAIRVFKDTGTWTSGTSQPVALLVTTTPDGSALAQERLRITSAGNVGIGTTSPGEALEVNGNIRLSSNSGSFRLFGAADSSNTTVVLQAGAASGTGGNIELDRNGDVVYDGTNHRFRNVTGGSDYARIDSSGRLLVGTSSSLQTKYQTSSFQPGFQSAATVGTGGFFRYSADSDGPAFVLSKSRNASLGSQTVLVDGDAVGYLGFAGSDGTAFQTAAIIIGQVDGTPGSTVMPGRLSFSTTSTTPGASPTERLRIDSNGFARYAGSIGRGAPVTKTGAFTVGIAENWLICNGTASITVTLPTASAWTGREIMLKTIAAFTVISASSNVVPLAGGAAGTAILAATAGRFATLVSDGTNWIIMQAN